MNIPVAATITPNSITLILDGLTHVLTQESHPNYSQIRDALKNKDVESVRSLLDLTKQLTGVMDGRVTVEHGVVQLDGETIHNVITDRIIEQYNEGFDASATCNFLSNLHDNPSKQAVDELYDFIEAASLPFTEDGHLLAYRMVNKDYTSMRINLDGTRNTNHIGDEVSMPRNMVDDRRDSTCSTGLHFCSQGYLDFYGGGVRCMVVKINPRDVVSIPNDYNNAKGRCCRYEVVGEIDRKSVSSDHTFGTSVMEVGRISGENGILYDKNVRPFEGQYISKRVACDWFGFYLDFYQENTQNLLYWCENNNIETTEVGDKTVIIWHERYKDELGIDFSWMAADWGDVDLEDEGRTYYDWGSRKEIADELGISTDAVRKRADRGTSVERSCISDNDGGSLERFRIIK